MKLLPLDKYRKNFKSDAACARALGVNYITLRRWLARDIISPDYSAWRALIAERGVELPRK
jgi:hypothetical protein